MTAAAYLFLTVGQIFSAKLDQVISDLETYEGLSEEEREDSAFALLAKARGMLGVNPALAITRVQSVRARYGLGDAAPPLLSRSSGRRQSANGQTQGRPSDPAAQLPPGLHRRLSYAAMTNGMQGQVPRYLSTARADRDRLPARELVRRRWQVLAIQLRHGRDAGAPRPGLVAGPLDRTWRVLPVRGYPARLCRPADAGRRREVSTMPDHPGCWRQPGDPVKCGSFRPGKTSVRCCDPGT